MRRIRKHALAESDLIGIWQYTFERWDAAQADKYLDELNDGIQQLAKIRKWARNAITCVRATASCS